MRCWLDKALELKSLQKRQDYARLRLGAGATELVDLAEIGCVDQEIGEGYDLSSVPFRDEVAGGMAVVGRRFGRDDGIEPARFLQRR